ncbi:plasmid partition protein A [Morganella morganii]|uniref:Plasmid partition protein A n=1 Tax=Morganella morganii TaxID=582 RepID=A0A433ZPT4_MORMO|nr:ParA family protein [Morganella morganii]RUT64126.1 plasmid partition protein A [Morganella morganii]
MSKVIMLGSHKGGVGKTTLAANIAVLLIKRGKRVIILKGDKNDELSDWLERRTTAGCKPVAIRDVQGNISGEIDKLRKMSDVVIVDTAGHDSIEFRSAISVADILLSPVRPSAQVEVDTIAAMTNVVRKAQELNNPQLQAYIVLARCKTQYGNTDASELTKSLTSNPIWLQPCKNRISQLDIFEKAFNEGKGVHELKKGSSLGKAKAQVELLIDELGA